MLMLSRRVGESIQIGDDVVVRITGMERNQVQVAIEAPHHVPIWRTEVLERIRAQQAGDRSDPP